MLRGAGARAPLQPPTPGEPPGEPPGPGAGPVLGARRFGPRRKQAAPAPGRHCGVGWGSGWRAEPSSPETGKEPSQERARQLLGGGQEGPAAPGGRGGLGPGEGTELGEVSPGLLVPLGGG